MRADSSASASRLAWWSLVEAAQQVELAALLGGRQAGVALEVVDGHALRVEGRALVDARQEARAPVDGVALGQAAAERVVHHDERGQVAALAAEAVGHPGADAGEAHARQAGVDLEQGGGVVVRLGPARVDEGHLIDVLRQVREDLRHPGPRVAVLLPGEGRLHERPDLAGEEAGLVVEALSFLPSRLTRSGL